MATTFNETPYTAEDFANRLDTDDTSDEQTIAWRDWDVRTGRPARWSKLHETRDRGVTTLCGAKVPTEVADSDCHGNGDRCQRCVTIAKTGR
jgi:hypothetical protein